MVATNRSCLPLYCYPWILTQRTDTFRRNDGRLPARSRQRHSQANRRHEPKNIAANFSLRQAFYRFRIPEHGVSELFLFAGGVVEPDVAMDRTKLDYGALMISAALKETFHIVNREPMPHSFVFDKSSLGMAQVC